MIWRLVSFLFGIWLMAAPSALAYGGAAAQNDRVFGPIIAAFSLIAASEAVSSIRMTNLPLGIWLVASPFVLNGYGFIPLWNSVATGVAVAALSLIPSSREKRFGEGWKPLFEVNKWTQ